MNKDERKSIDFNETIIFDRSISIRSENDIEDFLRDPKGFLERIGALEGLEEFNGFLDRDGNRIESIRDYFNDKGRGSEITIMHIGVPYRPPYFCSWIT